LQNGMFSASLIIQKCWFKHY